MSTETTSARQIQSEEDLWNASDEEILSRPVAAVEAPTEPTVEQEDAVEDSVEEAVEESSEDFSSGDDPGSEDADPSSGNQEDSDVQEEVREEDTSDEEDEDEDDTVAVEQTDNDSSVDYESEYQKLLAPFKANGREIKINNVDEAITLMQMGANYNKKMAALKPHLKTIKVLERSGIDSDEKLGYLLDLNRKDKKAIARLVKESGIDPVDLDLEEGDSDYRPSALNVSDQEMVIEEVLDNLQESKNYDKLINVVSKEWDVPSRRFISNNPQLLTVMNTHMDNGVYDMIQTELDRQRALGTLNGLNDLEAYKQIGDSIQAKGGFNHLFTQGQSNPPTRKTAPSKPKEEDPKLKVKRREAGSTKQTPKAQSTADFNPLSLSDEEFEKQFSSKLL